MANACTLSVNDRPGDLSTQKRGNPFWLKPDKLLIALLFCDNSHDQPPYHFDGSVVDYHENYGYGE